MRALLATVALAAGLLAVPALAADGVDTTGTVYSTDRVVVPLVFPVVGATSYSDNYLVCRSGCSRMHMGQDLMGARMSPLVAACGGVVTSLKRGATPTDGNDVVVACDQGAAKGWSTIYVHVNNDTPGTDDGRGTPNWAFPKGIEEGVRVLAGQLIGWRGDSGNAESTAPHLHFELRWGRGWSGKVYNAFPSLQAARRLAAPTRSGPHPEGTLLRSSTGSLYVVDDGRRHLVNQRVRVANGLSIFTAVDVPDAELALYPSGGRLSVRSGAVVRDQAGVVWRVAGRTRFPVTPVAGQRVHAVETIDLLDLEKVLAPAPPLLPEGLLVRVGADVHQVGEDGLLHRAGTFAMASYGFVAADVLPLPEGVDAPPVGDRLGLRDGTLVTASGRGTGVVSDGVFRRLRDARQSTAYGYDGRPRLTVLATHLEGMPDGEIAGQ